MNFTIPTGEILKSEIISTDTFPRTVRVQDGNTVLFDAIATDRAR
ncbi:hypothetical protein N9017_03015 [Akkermansiaceae bacterium]|nr:hypothetical protein [bacterium]MDB4489066.1 hypothetical protein [Akkermansiaceae bacterium]